jgi:hypothetical protein
LTGRNFPFFFAAIKKRIHFCCSSKPGFILGLNLIIFKTFLAIMTQNRYFHYDACSDKNKILIVHCSVSVAWPAGRKGIIKSTKHGSWPGPKTITLSDSLETASQKF